MATRNPPEGVHANLVDQSPGPSAPSCYTAQALGWRNITPSGSAQTTLLELKTLEITWLGHACFRVRTGTTTLLMDPFSPELGLSVSAAQGTANVVTASSASPFHGTVPPAEDDKAPVFIAGPGEYEAAGLHIRGIRTLGPPAGEEQTWNTVFLIEAEGLTLCHLGNPARLTDRQVEDAGGPQILLVPAGSTAGLSAPGAVELVNALEPKIVIPMLFAHPGNKAELRELAPFMQELGTAAPAEQSRVTVTRAALPEEMQLVLLSPTASMI